ncbi:hypothetical protein [Streptomyces sp. NPDC096132]|uniref:hypothetical protein n=1 Tax=Streptomyces sp. NPDC096132 TaxID=3366075 RepID=UPI00381AC3E5
MRVPVATLTACALSAVLLVAGRGGTATAGEENGTPPDAGVVLPAAEGQDAVEDTGEAVEDTGEIGPETVPELPDLPDGGGLVPDGPDESDTTEVVDGIALD